MCSKNVCEFKKYLEFQKLFVSSFFLLISKIFTKSKKLKYLQFLKKNVNLKNFQLQKNHKLKNDLNYFCKIEEKINREEKEKLERKKDRQKKRKTHEQAGPFPRARVRVWSLSPNLHWE